MALSKADIISTMCAQNPGTTRAAHTASFNNTMKAIETLLSQGNELTITRFGSFKIRDIPERPARNPITGEQITVPAFKRLIFKAASGIKESLNAGA